MPPKKLQMAALTLQITPSQSKMNTSTPGRRSFAGSVSFRTLAPERGSGRRHRPPSRAADERHPQTPRRERLSKRRGRPGRRRGRTRPGRGIRWRRRAACRTFYWRGRGSEGRRRQGATCSSSRWGGSWELGFLLGHVTLKTHTRDLVIFTWKRQEKLAAKKCFYLLPQLAFRSARGCEHSILYLEMVTTLFLSLRATMAQFHGSRSCCSLHPLHGRYIDRSDSPNPIDPFLSRHQSFLPE